MTQKEYEMPDEYKQQLAHLNEFLEKREDWRAMMKSAESRGVVVSPADKIMVDDQLKEFDKIIDNLEGKLAEEYERYQAEQRKEAEITKSVDKGWEASMRVYILTKHQLPHLLEKFTKQVLDPMDDDLREEFLDGVAILEATKLEAILKGED